MTALILHRGKLAASPYRRWLSDYAGDLVLLVSGEDLERYGETPPTVADGYAHVEVFPDYQTGASLDARVLELAPRLSVRHLVARYERDLIRAAVLRETLGLPGQRRHSAEAFCDKTVMKAYAEAAGLPVARHATVDTAADVYAFVARHGLPVVLKPRVGAGSVDTWIIRDEGELDRVLGAEIASSPRFLANMLVESFVSGPMYHVDGLVVDGRVVLSWPSRYVDSLVSYRGSGSRIDVTLAPDDPLTAPMRAFADRLVSALPTPPTCAFHAEVFHPPDGEIVLCEIACRAGGVAIRDIMAGMFGVDLAETTVRAQAGLPPPAVPATVPRRMMGQVLVMKRPGLVRAVPDRVPLDGVVAYRPSVVVGQRVAAPRFSGDVAALVVAEADTASGCRQRLEAIRTWFDARFEVQR